jgi:hypothetical protein
MWTPSALASEARPLKADLWRVVEAQHRVSTMRLTDSLDEQALLEDLIEEVKPPLPTGCEGLHYLLFTPFRHAPYPNGSRFRRAGQPEGAFYASEAVETAFAEVAFHRLVFFAASPGTVLPRAAAELTAFQARCAATAIDLARPPLAKDEAAWAHLVDYTACQNLADACRAAGIDAIRYRSARDPRSGMNVALLSPAAFAQRRPRNEQGWRMLISARSVRFWRDLPSADAIEFAVEVFAADPRLNARA